ncbi:MAG: cupin domain-containing protein [Acidimicrobiia bacterium]|nr:cupin domain-containing protein [Acidimicrobiia bacterium]
MMRALTPLLAIVLAGAATLIVACGSAERPRTTIERRSMQMATTINGEALPNQATMAFKSRELSREPSAPGMETVIVETIRKAGTRSPIHTHVFGGATCLVSGEMTLYLEGAEPAMATAGTCYFMPPDRLMSGVNSGTQTAVMHDIFTLPTGDPVWTIDEPGFDQ